MHFASRRIGLYSLVALLVVQSTHLMAQQPLPPTNLKPQEIYHAAWEGAAAVSYDQSKLAKWNDFAHKYCKDIQNDDDAVKFANKMLETLDDPYTILHSAKEYQALKEQMTGTMAGIGVQFAVKLEADGKTPALSATKRLQPKSDAEGNPLIEKVVDDGAAKAAGIQPGDAIVSINGNSVANKDLEDLKTVMRDKVGTTVKLVYRRDGKDTTVDIVRREVKLPPVHLPTKRFGKIGYLYLPSFTSNATVDELKEALSKLTDCDAYILDERFNTGGQIGVCLNAAGLFMDDGVITKIRKRVPFGGYAETVFRLGATDMAIEFKDETSGKTQTDKAPRQANMTGKKPIVLLTNGMSMSASEMLAGCLKDNNRAILVGEKTGGKGVGQEIFPLPNNTALRITNMRFFSPNGTWFGDGHNDRHGITPHHEVKLSDEKNIASDKDEQLNLAIKVLNEKLATK